MPALHVHHFGPQGRAPDVLALHGLTGHGLRWARMAAAEVPDARILAPDLRGHGRSPWAPPWGIDAHIADLVELLEEEAPEPVVLIGHSYGAAIAVHLARAVPEKIRALILLDPAMGLDPDWALEIAGHFLASPDYPHAQEARDDKANGGWSDVPADVLDADITEHLIDLPNGRVGWRICVPAAVAAWGEMARPAVLPPAGLATTMVRATRVNPRFITDAYIADLHAHLGAQAQVLEVDNEHMIDQSRPDLVGELLRKAL
ncbi:alpha/beta fold hydrolase [Tomitella biformata]|uniref:alpha/beta fold hydrolase n=1 Tax=Tomitella biformata TaxID=630403 RepID=UPI000466E356|nr:alpha/beta hydrolase [Tomitella biformata]